MPILLESVPTQQPVCALGYVWLTAFGWCPCRLAFPCLPFCIFHGGKEGTCLSKHILSSRRGKFDNWKCFFLVDIEYLEINCSWPWDWSLNLKGICFGQGVMDGHILGARAADFNHMLIHRALNNCWRSYETHKCIMIKNNKQMRLLCFPAWEQGPVLLVFIMK